MKKPGQEPGFKKQVARSMQRHSNRASRQLELPIQFVPASIVEQGLRDAHPRPLAKWYKTEVTRIGGRRVPTAQAFEFPLVEMQPANSRAVVALDLDGAGKFTFADCCLSESLPPGNQTVERIESGNLHVFYYLEKPVHWGPWASRKPREIFTRVSEYFTHVSGADPSYNRTLMRNPVEGVHLDARALDGACRTHPGPTTPYPLLDLLRYVPPGWRLPTVPLTAEGGHLALIRATGKWYGRPTNWIAAAAELERKIHELNETMKDPRPSIEVREIARWLYRKQSKRLESGQQQRVFSMMQAARAIRPRPGRRKGTPLEDDRRPWEAEGVSKPTWYRDRARSTPKGKHGGKRR